MMIRILLFVFLLMEGTVVAEDLAQDMQVISDRLRSEWTERVIVQNRVQELIGAMDDEGRWAEIDYDNDARTHWSPSRHTRQLSDLAEVYRVQRDVGVRDAVLRGLQFWADSDPQSDNWWWNCIDTPRNLSKVLLLMGDVVSSDLMEKAAQIVRRSSFKRTGANLTNEASNLMVLACALRDESLLRESIAYLTQEIRIVPGEEGIQPDHSFYQHGPQLQISSYAQVFMLDATHKAVLLEGTSFALSDEKIAILSTFVREGQQWFSWGYQVDYHAMGRSVGRVGVSNRGTGFAVICDRMEKVDAEHVETYRNFAARVRGDLPRGETGPKGNRHFYRSDVMVHRPGAFYTSVRMHSTRTYACEVRTNRENLKGYHLSDGAYFLMQSGNEYYDIQPVWDWRKLPGVTYRDTDDSFPYGRDAKQAGNTDFVGGVSDGLVGMAVMDYAKEDVRAHKAYFFFEDGFVCLGAGIESQTEEHVTTSLNQCILNGKVTILRQGDDLVAVDRGQWEGEDVRGVFHENVGYYALGSQHLVVRADTQSGRWTDLEEASSHKELLTHDVFSAWIDHGERVRDGSYAYAVMPGLDRERFVVLADDFPFQVLSNTPSTQAVFFSEEDILQAAFFEAGALAVPDGVDIAVDAPCLLMVRTKGDRVIVSVSDPAQKLDQIRVTLSGAFDGIHCVVKDDVSEVTVDLPQDEWSGKTVQVELVNLEDK
jgi:chondroitin AC lyase